MKKLSISFLLFIFLIPAVSFGANIIGTWTINGAGYTGKLIITQGSNGLTGTVYGDAISNVSVQGNTVKFTRTNTYLTTKPGVHPQQFEGYLFVKGPMTMAGKFKHKGVWTNGFYATK